MKKFIGSMLTLAFMITMTGIFNPLIATAASITVATDTVSRLQASTAADHTIVFTTPTGITSGKTVILTFDNGTSTAGVVVGDIDVLDGATPVTVVSGAPGPSEWGFVNTSSTVLTFTLGASASIASGHVVTIKIGTNAGGTHQITNGPTGTTTLSLSGTMADSGVISMAIMDSDQVLITASVNQSLSFDLDTGITAGKLWHLTQFLSEY